MMKDFIRRHKYTMILMSIWILSVFIRVYHLGILPSSLMDDEVLSGYVGRFILKNGVDLYGNTFPLLYFDKFGDYYIIGPMYLAGISTFIFGITAFAVRFPVALFGSLIVFPLYYFTQTIFSNKKISLLAALFIAIVPWHVTLSRSSTEGIIGSTVFLSGIVLILSFIKSSKKLFFYLGGLLIFSSYFIYHPFRMYAPLALLPIPFLFPSLWFWKKERNISQLLSIAALIILFFGITFYISTTPWGQGRFEQTSIFSPLARVEGRIQEQIFNLDGNRIFEARLFHNKVIGYGREFVTQYLSYFSPVFLFMQAGAENRYDMPDQGLAFITYLLFLIAALVPVKNKLKISKPHLWYFYFLLAISPIPAALTYLGSPNVHRALFLIVLLMIPVAYGAYNILSFRFGRLILSVLGIVLFCEFLYFWHQYSVQSDVYNALRRNDGQKELIEYLKKNESNYDHIYLPSEGTMSLYLLFYKNNFDSKLVGTFNKGTRLDMDSLGKYTFTTSSCPTNDMKFPQGKILIINKYDCEIPSELIEVQRIKGKHALLGFDIYTRDITVFQKK